MGKPANSTNKRKGRSAWLIGGFIEKITGSKLPSKRQVLGNFLHFHQIKNLCTQESATNTANEVLKFWEKARIPTTEKYNIINKIKKCHEKWIKLKKSHKRVTKTQKKWEGEFSEVLDDVFDVSHSNAMNLIEIDEDREFLVAQREKGRRGTMAQIDMILHQKEKRKFSKEDKVLSRKMKEQERLRLESQTAEIEDSDEENVNIVDDLDIFPIPRSRNKLNLIRVMTPEVTSVFDRVGINDSKAMFILAATFKSIGVKNEEICLSQNTIKRARRQNRQTIANEIKKSFNPDDQLTVHWDSKLLATVTGKKEDRLAVLITGESGEKLLGVPDTEQGTGKVQSSAVFKLLSEWKLVDRVSSMSFDTTATNTGINNGACVLLEGLMKKKLLHLACRHHILELIVAKVFDTIFGVSKAPTIPLFQKFSSFWSEIVKNGLQDQYSSAMDDGQIKNQLEKVKQELVTFIKTQLEQMQPRHDYKELLELSALFLGENLNGWVTIRTPGACHRARWMAKIIYCLKIYLFRQHFPLSDCELSFLRDFNLFVLQVYLKSWFTAQCSASAPRHDLNLLKRIVDYKSINETISKVAFHSFSGHLWYMSETLIGLSFFDSELSTDMKKKMVKGLEREGNENPVRRIQLEEKVVKEKELHHFVTCNTRTFFTSMNICMDFLQLDPALWESSPDYRKARERIQKLKVVNDCAERGIALIQTFNSILTSQEEQNQYLLQVVENQRLSFAKPTKSVLMG